MTSLRAGGGRAAAALASFVLIISLIAWVPASAASESHGEGHGGLVHGSPWASVGVSFVAIAILVGAGLLATRSLSRIPGPLQNFMEMVVGGLETFFAGVLGPGGERHVPLLITLFLYILVMNLMGLTGLFIPPTSTLNMTIALALAAIIYVQIEGIRAHGLGGYVKHFLGEPLWLAPLMLPLHIIGELAKPLSLSFRLFGNIFGEETVVTQIALLGPVVLFGARVIPIQAPLLVFGLLKALIQALVFSVLTAAYLVIMTSHEEEHHDHGAVEATGGVEPAHSPASAAA